MERLVDKIDPTDGLRESAMSDLDVEIQSAGGLDAWIKATKEKLKRISKDLHFLDTQARREINAGGAFDSVQELEDAIEAEQREYNELKDKYDFVASSTKDNIKSNKSMNNFNEVFNSSRSSRKSRKSKLTEYVQLKIDPKEMIDDIDTIYYHSGDTDAIEKILFRNGSDPSKDDWTIGLDIPSAYADVIEYAKKRYPDPDYDELPYAIGEIIYPEVFNEGYQESKLTESVSSGTYIWDGKSSVPKEDVVTVKIKDGVTRIGYEAFRHCEWLRSVEIPNSVTEIDAYAFADCDSLETVNISNGVTEIGENAFSNCYSLKSVNIPNSVTKMGGGIFYDCNSLRSINIPNSVTEIGEWAFAYCKSLESVNIPNSVTEIGKKAFYYCESLRSINIPNSVTRVGVRAFYGCPLDDRTKKRVNEIVNNVKMNEVFNESKSEASSDDKTSNAKIKAVRRFKYYVKNKMSDDAYELKKLDGMALSKVVSVLVSEFIRNLPKELKDSVTKNDLWKYIDWDNLPDDDDDDDLIWESKLTESSMSRREMIDWIDDNYNTDENYEKLRNAISMIGYDADYIDDSDSKEGMYANFSDEELSSIIYILKAREENSSPRQSSKIKSDFTNMSRKEMIDWLEDNWNTSEGYEQLNAAIDAIGYDSDHIDDSDEEEGMYANFSDEDLENIISVLKTGKTKDGHATSVKPQRIPMTDKKAKDMFKLALNDLGRAIEIDKGTGSALAMYSVMIDGKEYQVQIYRMG